MFNNLFGIFPEHDLPMKHQIGRAIFAGVVSVVISTLCEKGYDVKMKPMKRR